MTEEYKHMPGFFIEDINEILLLIRCSCPKSLTGPNEEYFLFIMGYLTVIMD